MSTAEHDYPDEWLMEPSGMGGAAAAAMSDPRPRPWEEEGVAEVEKAVKDAEAGADHQPHEGELIKIKVATPTKDEVDLLLLSLCPSLSGYLLPFPSPSRTRQKRRATPDDPPSPPPRASPPLASRRRPGSTRATTRSPAKTVTLCPSSPGARQTARPNWSALRAGRRRPRCGGTSNRGHTA